MRLGLLEFKDSFAARYFDDPERTLAKLKLTFAEPADMVAADRVGFDAACAVCITARTTALMIDSFLVCECMRCVGLLLCAAFLFVEGSD